MTIFHRDTTMVSISYQTRHHTDTRIVQLQQYQNGPRRDSSSGWTGALVSITPYNVI